MTEPNETLESASFLDEDLSTVDTSMPLVKDGVYDLKIAELTEKVSEKSGGKSLAFKLELTTDALDIQNNPLKAGFPLFSRISITPTKDYSEEQIKKNVARFIQAVNGTRLYPLSQFVGQIVRAKVKVRGEREDKKTGETYPPSNEISFIKAD